MTECGTHGCSNPPEEDSDICFRHRVMGVGVHLKGPALTSGGSDAWNKSKNEHMLENFGTTDDRELGKRGIERAPA